MYDIRGIAFSFNTTKVIYVAEQLGADYNYKEVNLSEGEHKTPEHLQRHPLGKMPTLTHEGQHIFESGAICRYLAVVEGSPLYPAGESITCAHIDQWMDAFSIHLGRWTSSLLFERVFKQKFNMGETDEAAVEEALGFLDSQFSAVESAFEGQDYLVGNTLTIADLFAYAYIETTDVSGYSLAKLPNISSWRDRISNLDAVQNARNTTLASAT